MLGRLTRAKVRPLVCLRIKPPEFLPPVCRCLHHEQQQQPPISFSIRRLTSHTVQSGHTIFAISSGTGKCGVSVVRLSGPHTWQALLSLLGGQSKVHARKACLRRLHHPESGEVLDEALVLWMPGPGSFTGEDVAELHCHGSVAVLSAVMAALSTIPGLRAADAGEFTRRAFHNGRLDLTAVEGLADLIHSETEAQRRQAFRQMQGELSMLYQDWSQRLLKCVADITAVIDFGEEEAVDAGTLATVQHRLDAHSLRWRSPLTCRTIAVASGSAMAFT
eukprot:scpid47481/ scgid33553/ tRNA modification GTPase GTPBP3, mitochondrial; GTP-binding protein 3